MSTSASADILHTLASLSQLHWNKRVLIVNTGSHKTLEILKQHKTPIEERHLIWFVLVGDTITSNYPGPRSTELHTEILDIYRRANTNVILLGKDGDVKLTSSTLDLAQIYATIDEMPMRKREMKAE